MNNSFLYIIRKRTLIFSFLLLSFSSLAAEAVPKSSASYFFQVGFATGPASTNYEDKVLEVGSGFNRTYTGKLLDPLAINTFFSLKTLYSESFGLEFGLANIDIKDEIGAVDEGFAVENTKTAYLQEINYNVFFFGFAFHILPEQIYMTPSVRILLDGTVKEDNELLGSLTNGYGVGLRLGTPIYFQKTTSDHYIFHLEFFGELTLDIARLEFEESFSSNELEPLAFQNLSIHFGLLFAY